MFTSVLVLWRLNLKLFSKKESSKGFRELFFSPKFLTVHSESLGRQLSETYFKDSEMVSRNAKK